MARNGTSKGLLLFFLLLLVVATIVFLGTDYFHIKSITVTGNEAIDDEVIIRMSGINIGENIFQISKPVVKKRIEENPPFLVLNSVSLLLPDKVVISVSERKQAALIPYLSSYILIDRTGFVLDIIKQEKEASLPIITGIRLKSYSKGKYLEASSDDDYKYKALKILLESLYNQGANELIYEINIADADNIMLKSIHGIDIVIGQAINLDKKVSWLLSDAYDLIISKYSSGIFDVSVEEPIFLKSKDEDEGKDED